MGINVTLRGGSGDMLKSVYDSNLDGVIALAELDTGIMRKVADSDLSMGAHNITLSAGQTVDSKDITDLGTRILRHDAEVTEAGGAYVKKKTFTFVEQYAGKMGVVFDTKHSSGGATTHGRVYKNGVALGTEKNTTSTSYVVHHEWLDVGLIAAGETIELWLYPDAGVGIASARNFRLTLGAEATIS